MPTSKFTAVELLKAVRMPRDIPRLAEMANMLAAKQDDPKALCEMALKAVAEAEHNRRCCTEAASAAESLERLLRELGEGTAVLWHLDQVLQAPPGLIAVCRLGEQLREFAVHPNVNLDELKALMPWEFVRMRENVVVGVHKDDADRSLYHAAQGEVVTFREYANRGAHLVRVAWHGDDERVVKLAPPLRDQELSPGAKLVLQRDQPQQAIARLPAQVARSRFEVPLDQITTRLEDLAGLSWVAEKLVMNVFKRTIRPDIRATYGLKPLKGALLLSRKPGQGKTTLVRSFAKFLQHMGQQHAFDVVLYHVKPNETKSMWHGEDARIVREDLFGAMRARRSASTDRTLFQLLVIDEIDSLGRRSGAGDVVTSAAQSDALEALLVELDGFVQEAQPQQHEAHLLVIGMSNRPDRIDDAIKRPGRLGDLVLELDGYIDQEAAEEVCSVYARGQLTPWQINGKVQKGPAPEPLGPRILKPAVAHVYPLVVLHYYSDTQRKFDVTAGQILSGAHYEQAMAHAKDQASTRKLLGSGNPAVTYDDVLEGLLTQAVSLASQMAADPSMLVRQLDIKVPVARVESVPRQELETHRFLRLASE